jgi:hypothetical protein
MLRKCLGEGYHIEKIQEGSAIHPMNSNYGVIGLAYVFYENPITFVRIKRNPIDIFESFYATRLDGVKNQKLKRSTDEDVFRYIDNERDSVEVQKMRLDEYKDVHNLNIEFIELDYDKMNVQPLVERFNKRSFNEFHNEYWLKKPVREGRISAGIKHSLIPDKIMEELKKRYEKI